MRMSTGMSWLWPEVAEQISVILSLTDQIEELIIFQAMLQIGSLGISVRIPKEMFLMAVNVFPVTYKMRAHTQRVCTKQQLAWKRNQLVCKGASKANDITRGSLISRTNNDSHCPSACVPSQGVQELDAGHVHSPASTLENSKGPCSVSITLFTCLLLWVS